MLRMRIILLKTTMSINYAKIDIKKLQAFKAVVRSIEDVDGQEKFGDFGELPSNGNRLC